MEPKIWRYKFVGKKSKLFVIVPIIAITLRVADARAARLANQLKESWVDKVSFEGPL
jgi:hypothetical protein